MSITIKDIARLAGTSRGTVDRVINNRGNVKADLKEKILSIIDQYDYHPNISAKLLSNKKNKMKIGIIINSIGNEFFHKVILGINDAAKEVSESGVEVIVKELKGYNATTQINAIDSFIKDNVDAIILTPIDDETIIHKLQDLKIPFAFLNSDLPLDNKLVSVACDNTLHGKMAGSITNMIVPNSSNIAIVTGSKLNDSNNKRIKGYSETIKDNNNHILEIIENEDDDETSFIQTKQLIEKYPNLDLIYFCAGGIEGGIKAVIQSTNNIKCITVDDNEFTKEAVENGIISATLTQDSYAQGYKPIKIMTDFLIFGRKPLKNKIHTESRIKIKYSKW